MRSLRSYGKHQISKVIRCLLGLCDCLAQGLVKNVMKHHLIYQIRHAFIPPIMQNGKTRLIMSRLAHFPALGAR